MHGGIRFRFPVCTHDVSYPLVWTLDEYGPRDVFVVHPVALLQFRTECFCMFDRRLIQWLQELHLFDVVSGYHVISWIHPEKVIEYLAIHCEILFFLTLMWLQVQLYAGAGGGCGLAFSWRNGVATSPPFHGHCSCHAPTWSLRRQCRRKWDGKGWMYASSSGSGGACPFLQRIL